MTGQVYINGCFVLKSEAKVSIFDSGFCFGDGVYQVILRYNGKMISTAEHLEKLKSYVTKAKIKNVPNSIELLEILNQLCIRNEHIQTGMIIVQVTRGEIKTRYQNPLELEKPSIIAYILPCEIDFDKIRKSSISASLVVDGRRFDKSIKMFSLMPMVLDNINARESANDYVIYKDFETAAITEGRSSNLFIVTKDNEVWTHPLGYKILPGCTRAWVLNALRTNGIAVFEKEFFERDLFNASEVFITGSIKLFCSITKINQVPCGSSCGKIINLLVYEYQKMVTSVLP